MITISAALRLFFFITNEFIQWVHFLRRNCSHMVLLPLFWLILHNHNQSQHTRPCFYVDRFIIYTDAHVLYEVWNDSWLRLK